MTCDEFTFGIFMNADYDGLWKDSLNVSSKFIAEWRFCSIVLANVYND